jgi:LacI family transcriptional regulator
MAQGIMAGLASRGLAVPSDFSLIGCDGVLATTTYPPLTSVESHCAAAGERAVDLLLEGLQAGAQSAPGLNLATELIIRASTAPPPSALHTKRGADTHAQTRPVRAHISMEKS